MADNSAHLQQRRQSILAAAQKVFDLNGYASTTMDEVAAEAGISKGSLYNYFSCKRELFSQVFVNALAGDQREMEKLVGQPLSASQKIGKLVEFWFSQFEHYTRIGGLILEFWANAAREQRKGQLAPIFTEMYGSWRDLIGGIVKQGIDSGEFGGDIDPMVAAALIMGTMRGIVVQVILDVQVPVTDELQAAFKRGLLAGLTARAGGGQDKTDHTD